MIRPNMTTRLAGHPCLEIDAMIFLAHLVADLFSTVLVWAFCWLIALFVRNEQLPRWLAWAGTLDNSMAGDGAWQRMEPGHWAWRAHLPCGLDTYVGHVGWLIRNPAYVFNERVLSALISPTDTVEFKGNLWVQDKPKGIAGYCYTTVGDYWHLCWVKDIGVWFGVHRCLYWNFGWRLKTYAEDKTRLKTQPRAMFVVSPRFAELAQ